MHRDRSAEAFWLAILDPLQAQAGGRERWSCGAAVFACDDGGDDGFGHSAAADFEEGSGDDADHVVEEAAAADFDADAFGGEGIGRRGGDAEDVAGVDGADGGEAAVVGGGEGDEVVLADEVLGGAVHAFAVERFPAMVDEVAVEEWSVVAGVEGVGVGLAVGVGRWVECLVDRLNGGDHDIVG